MKFLGFPLPELETIYPICAKGCRKIRDAEFLEDIIWYNLFFHLCLSYLNLKLIIIIIYVVYLNPTYISNCVCPLFSITDNPKLSLVCFAFFVVLGTAVGLTVALRVYKFNTLKSVTGDSKFKGNDMVALSTVDAYKHRRVEVSLIGENQKPVEIFSASSRCNRLKTGSRPYSFTFKQDASLMYSYSVTADYFATGSKLMFQANTTAKVDRFNCSSAVYIFDDSDSYNNFLGYESTKKFVSRLCFNLSGNGSYYNQVQSYSMKESSYLFIGLYLPPISIASHVDLSISGTQNFYIVADLISRCNLSSTQHTCPFTVSTNFVVTSKHICILGRGSSSDSKEHVVELKSMTSFPNNVVVFVLLFLVSLFSLIAIILLTLIIILRIFVCFCNRCFYCYRNSDYTSLQ